jgi:hypothetical protein
MKLNAAWLAALFALAAALVACGGDNPESNEPGPSARPTQRTQPGRTGPSLTVDPRSGPPGTLVTVSGSGWPGREQIQITAVENPTNAAPFAQVTTGEDGAFTARFRLDRAPDGSQLKVGPFNLLARSGGAQATVAFQVESPRPVRGPGDGG